MVPPMMRTPRSTSVTLSAPGGATEPGSVMAGPPGRARAGVGCSKRSRSRPGSSLEGICASAGEAISIAAARVNTQHPPGLIIPRPEPTEFPRNFGTLWPWCVGKQRITSKALVDFCRCAEISTQAYPPAKTGFENELPLYQDTGALWVPALRGACHRAALRADPLARPGHVNP